MYLIDTDILIDHLRRAKSIDESLKGILQDPDDLYISTLTEMEIWSGYSTQVEQTAKAVEDILSLFQKISPDSTTSKLAGILRRDYKLSPVDSIIAATAITQNFILITKNRKHYQALSNLRIRK